MFFKLNSSSSSDLINVNVSLHDHEKLESCSLTLCLLSSTDDDDDDGQVNEENLMMIRHTAQSGIAQLSLSPRRTHLSIYPLLLFLSRPARTLYHNSDISLLALVSLSSLSLSRSHTSADHSLSARARDFNEFFFSRLAVQCAQNLISCARAKNGTSSPCNLLSF